MKVKKNKKSSFKYLARQIKTKSYVSTMLFMGPKNAGKFSAALNFAQTIICERENGTFCGTCGECTLTKAQNHPDLLVLDEKENIKIDQIRELQKKLYLKPYRAKNKIAIVNNVHLLTEEGSNSFLKILEEPPQNSIIILITPVKDLLLPTIVSRSQVIKFNHDSPEGFADDEKLESDAQLILKPSSLKEGFDIAVKYSNNTEMLIPLFDVMEKILRNTLLSLNNIKNTGSTIEDRENDVISKLDSLAEARTLLRSNINTRFLLENLIIRNQNGQSGRNTISFRY